jgi:membrane protein required for colicin V production
MGSLFGAVRGILLVALGVFGGQLAGFDDEDWWANSRLIPYAETVADWIEEMAPQGIDLITPDEAAKSLSTDIPIEL